jgi:homoserine dehydrogenase
MFIVEVLKFGSSVLRSAADLPIAADEIYRRWRAGSHILAVVSAFEGITDQLLSEVSDDTECECREATAAYVSTGEQKTAALLLGTLRRCGMPSRIVEPREIGLTAKGSILESAPISVDVPTLRKLWIDYPILVLPGFYGIDVSGTAALFGRGGSDISALFLAAELGGKCRLIKDVPGVFDSDPARLTTARRFAALSWDMATEVAGPLIQPKALSFAQSRELAFEVGRPNENAGTIVGHTVDEWAPPVRIVKPLRVAIAGCGVVGRGVYESVKRYPDRFEVAHVIVRDVDRYAGVDHVSADLALALAESVDVVIVCFGGVEIAHPLIAAALRAGKFVITANKAAIAAHGSSLASYTRGDGRRLWYSAAVGGAVPVLEALAARQAAVSEIRGVINGTCGVVLDAWERGATRLAAVAMAQSAGFAEENPTRDLSGRDSADKLVLLIEAAFQQCLEPEDIPTRGIDTIVDDPAGYKLMARARLTPTGIDASIKPEVLVRDSFLGQARGAENRIEIELVTGKVIRLRGQGAGRWPTAVSVMADLHEVARTVEMGIESPTCGSVI